MTVLALPPVTDLESAQFAFDQVAAYLNQLGAVQPLDSDLTAIAALTTTAYGRAFLALANAAAGRAALNIASGTTSMTGDGTPSKALVVTHGLGTTPGQVGVFPAAGGTGSRLLGSAGAKGATTFTATLAHVDLTNWSSTQNFDWLAIG